MTTPTMAPTWPPAQPGAGQTSYSAPAFTSVQVRQNFGQANTQHAYAAYRTAAPTRTNVNSVNENVKPVNEASTQHPYAAYQTAAPAQANVSSVTQPNSAQEDAPKKPRVEWPQSVRDYVQRSFIPSNMDPSVSRAEMEAKLKETISRANDDNLMYSIDWASMPLPQQMIKQERARVSALPRMMQQVQVSQVQVPPADTKATSNAPTMTYAQAASNSSNSKKRKSSDFADSDLVPSAASMPPPWKAGQSSASLQDRITFSGAASRRQAHQDNHLPAKSKSQRQMEKRQKRFDGGYRSAYRSPSPPPSTGPVVGTSQELLKRYLRLTSAPNPSNVRPESILRQTLVLLKKKWSEEENYNFICDQFKSLRQDLTVQRLHNDFTVEVYECHARIALEKGDLGEYNQCQTQLKSLYKKGLKGNPSEFKAYRILYFIHTSNRLALNDILATLTPAEKKDKGVKHALDVRSALALGNYHRFFKLFAQTPNMGGWLMDMFVTRERVNAMCYICKSYKQTVPLRFITDELFFETDADAAQFILDYDGRDLLEEKNGEIIFHAPKGYRIFEEHRAVAFSRIDIKGQI